MSNSDSQDEFVPVNNPGAFTPDPVHKIMGIFENSDEGVAAVGELKSNNFDAGDIELFCGIPGEEAYDFSGDDHGPLMTFMRKFRNMTFDRVIMERYQQALRDGHCVLTLHIQDSKRKKEAADLMHSHGAAQVDYFGLAMTQAFPAQPNASEDKYNADPLDEKNGPD